MFPTSDSSSFWLFVYLFSPKYLFLPLLISSVLFVFINFAFIKFSRIYLILFCCSFYLLDQILGLHTTGCLINKSNSKNFLAWQLYLNIFWENVENWTNIHELQFLSRFMSKYKKQIWNISICLTVNPWLSLFGWVLLPLWLLALYPIPCSVSEDNHC